MSTVQEMEMEEGTKKIEEEPVVSASTSTSSSRSNSLSRKKLLWILLGIAAIVALAVGLGVGLSNDDDDSIESSETSLSASNSVSGSSGTSTNSSGSSTGTSSGTGSGTSTNSSGTTTNSSGTTTNTNSNSTGTNTSIPGTTLDDGTSFAVRLAAISPETIKQTYASCDAMKEDLTTVARLIGLRAIDSYAWYFDPSYQYPVMEGAPSMDAGTSAGDSSNEAIGSTSYGTNNQVDGVEEGDIVQSNGVQAFAVYGREILELNAAAATITSRTKLPALSADCYSDYINNMVLIGERLVVVTSRYCSTSPATGAGGAEGTTSYSMPIMLGSDTTHVLIYDTTNMSLLNNFPIQGSYISVRTIGANVHIVTTSWFDTYGLTQYLDPWIIESRLNKTLSYSEYRKQAKMALESHLGGFVQQLIAELDCTGMQKLALLQNTNDTLNFGGNLDSIATITSFNATNSVATKSTSSMMLPNGGFQVYSSADRLVLAIQGWWVGGYAKQETYLVTYKLIGASAKATTLGTIPGYVLNQFSIDHANQNGVDYLRVATSTFSQWVVINGEWTSQDDSTSQVTVLEINDNGAGQMPVIGQLTGLGKPGEQITSVRFLGNRGYVVTFKQTDPFYTLDLTDPKNPKAVGELKIPGFSNYLHPVGEDRLIGVGQSADANGTPVGLQISLFDVSNFSSPVRLQNLAEVGSSNTTSSSYSEAQYNPKAFRYLDDSQLLIIPLSINEYTVIPCQVYGGYPGTEGMAPDVMASTESSSNATVGSSMLIDDVPINCYNNTGSFDGFRLYKIDASLGITEYFSIAHATGYLNGGCWSSSYLQARSLVFDGDIMTFKGHSILSNDLTTRLADAPPINLDTEVVLCQPYLMD